MRPATTAVLFAILAMTLVTGSAYPCGFAEARAGVTEGCDSSPRRAARVESADGCPASIGRRLAAIVRGRSFRTQALVPDAGVPATAEPRKEENEPRRSRFFHSARGAILAVVVGALVVGGLARSSLNR